MSFQISANHPSTLAEIQLATTINNNNDETKQATTQNKKKPQQTKQNRTEPKRTKPTAKNTLQQHNIPATRCICDAMRTQNQTKSN
jgi:hypothetical protein